MQIIPAIDVLDGRVVRLLRGDFAAVTEYSPDPIEMVRSWGAQGAELVHLVDLAGARTGRPDEELWSAIAQVGVPFQVGGGIRTAAVATKALQVGARRVVLGSAAVWEPKLLRELVTRFGSERIVAALDVRAGRAHAEGWMDEGRGLEEVLEATVAAGCRLVLATGIARDGTMQGPDLELVGQILALDAGLSVIGSGGVGSLSDLAALAEAGAAAVVVGRALYEGKFSLAEAVAVAS